MLQPSIGASAESSVSTGYMVVVVTETDQLQELARAAIQEAHRTLQRQAGAD